MLYLVGCTVKLLCQPLNLRDSRNMLLLKPLIGIKFQFFHFMPLSYNKVLQHSFYVLRKIVLQT